MLPALYSHAVFFTTLLVRLQSLCQTVAVTYLFVTVCLDYRLILGLVSAGRDAHSAAVPHGPGALRCQPQASLASARSSSTGTLPVLVLRLVPLGRCAAQRFRSLLID